MIGPRRIRMTADRIEALCAEYKLSVTITPIRVGKRRVTFLARSEQRLDMRTLAEHIELALGVPVTAYRDVVICAV